MDKLPIRPRSTVTGSEGKFPIRPLPSKVRNLSPEFIRQMSDPEIREANRRKGTIANLTENKKMGRRLKRFVAELLADPARNAVQAAMRAGYAESTAYTAAGELRKDVRVQEIIAAADREVFTALDINHERILQEMANIAFANIEDYIEYQPDGGFKLALHKIDRQQAAVIKEVVEEGFGQNRRVKFSLYDKMSALTILGKHLGMFREKSNSPFDGDGKNIVLTVNMIDKIVAGELTFNQVQQEAAPAGVRILEGGR